MRVAGVAGAAAAAAWLGVLLHPARPWTMRPDDEEVSPPPARWPEVCVLVPARNEAATLPATLPALLAQDYPGPWRVVLVDDRSGDGTAEVADGLARRAGGSRLRVLRGASLPPGWVGKVWALEQARRAAGMPEWLLLTDADIRHAPGSLRSLVAAAVARGSALESRMARLRTGSRAERLLVPPFVLFFLLLYPPRWANRPGSRLATAAGGCVLVRRAALEAAGGFAAIRGALIDDLALARAVKRVGPTRMALSRGRVASVRASAGMGPLWRTVRRSAFTQLGHSWPLTGATVAAGAAAWALAAAVSAPAVRFHGLPRRWCLSLPPAGLLYAGMTLDSALRGPPEGGWR